VLLKGVNDNPQTLINLSNRLWQIGVLPYYLHTLDKVSGCEDYLVDDKTARKIYQIMQENLSGYLLPKLVRDEGKKYKTIL
jgi:L-lysine 2,3-aminomutase